MATYNKIPKARIIYVKAFTSKLSNQNICECEHREGCKCDECTGKPTSECQLHMLKYSYSDYLVIQWACRGSSAYIAGFRTNDLIVAVNDVFGKCDKLLGEMDRPYIDTKRPMPNTLKLKLLVMNRECYDYYCYNYGNNGRAVTSMEDKYFQGRIYNKTICRRRDKTLEDLCCDHFKMNYTFADINNVFEQLNIPLPLQDKIKDAYDFYYQEGCQVKDGQETTDLLLR